MTTPELRIAGGSIPEHHGRIRLRFEGRSAPATLQELPAALDRWNTILSHFSRVAPGTSPRALLAGMAGTPVVVDLAVPAPLVAPMQIGLSGLRDALDEVVVLATKVDELRRLAVRPEILQSLDEQVRDNRQIATARIADEIRTRFRCDQDARNAVHKALVAMATFVEEGGQIEIDLGPAAAVGATA